ncbi:membrane protein insertase YidC [Nostocoides sp.]|jgi:YidC/Oxa1 family membrane protein insertase|uniref:membrane protein insertase YidC n=1 Tax=Nostocoides sp. TaxID=1917966 RepID=UPI002C93ECF5|nr:membrane protein insertase YidC [Tetrasphaera sp.]
MGDFFNSVMYPIEWVVAWIMYGFHSFFTAIGMPEGSGWTWGLSIVGLVIVMRALLIPLFVKQIQASRKMQMISPEIQKIQAKYKGKTDPESRQKMTQETMDLYRTTGTNPFSSCLPILAQSPIFFGLFRVLNGLEAIAEGRRDGIGPITQQVASQAERAEIFGAQLSDVFLRAESTNTRIVTIVLIILMSVTTFTTQRQLMTKNMPASALDNPFARQQKILLYVLPLVFAISGVNFPIGVLIYWFVTNVWSMCQQFYVIRRMPTPGSLAEKALHERRLRKGKATPADLAPAAGGSGPVLEEPVKPSGQRQQPKRKDRTRKPPATGQNKPPATGQNKTTDKRPKPGPEGPRDAGRASK